MHPPLISAASGSTVGSLFTAQVQQAPEHVALSDKSGRTLTYAVLEDRRLRLASALLAQGVGRGSRIAVLSENRFEYLEVMLAAAAIGATVACQNWRLAVQELEHCLELVAPAALFASPRHAAMATRVAGKVPLLVFGDAYESLLTQHAPLGVEAQDAIPPEESLLILYTSGTTGRPKGAVISHRAQVFRNLVTRAEFGIEPLDTFAAWSPLYHMGAVDNSLGTLMTGGKVVVVDGFDSEHLAHLVSEEPLGWLLLMPGMISAFAEVLERRQLPPRAVRLCGVMADLVPPDEIARITRLLRAPYANTFGATETGCPPCSSNRIPIGVAPRDLAKEKSPYCEIRLVDADDKPVPPGTPGELCIRGFTLFSGYYAADEVNRHEFRGGWFHMGDVFVQSADGKLRFVDRVKYLIKSGGENIYPAEIERVLLGDPGVSDAAVVRRPDARWGEVPVAFVSRTGTAVTEGSLLERCRAQLARYKLPKQIVFISSDAFPRSASGKIQRHELEKLLPTSREGESQ